MVVTESQELISDCHHLAGADLLVPFKMSRKGLMEQDLNKLDVTKLHPLSPEVISRQATINLGNYVAMR